MSQIHLTDLDQCNLNLQHCNAMHVCLFSSCMSFNILPCGFGVSKDQSNMVPVAARGHGVLGEHNPIILVNSFLTLSILISPFSLPLFNDVINIHRCGQHHAAALTNTQIQVVAC